MYDAAFNHRLRLCFALREMFFRIYCSCAEALIEILSCLIRVGNAGSEIVHTVTLLALNTSLWLTECEHVFLGSCTGFEFHGNGLDF